MTLSQNLENRILDLVRLVSSEVILPRFRALGDGEVDMKKDADDLVTVADREAEARLSHAIRELIPEARVVGEEAIAGNPALLDDIGGQGLCVILDPVDGTWNFAHGLPLFGVIVAVVQDGDTVWGGIYDPIVGDWVVASKGQGTWFVARDGSRRRLKLSAGPGTATGARGNLPINLFPGAQRAAVAALLPDFQRAPTLRCSAHDYRMQAQGSFDFSICPVLNAWDHAAGCLMVREAGGVARLLDGRDYLPTHREGVLLTARSEGLWNNLAEKFAAFG